MTKYRWKNICGFLLCALCGTGCDEMDVYSGGDDMPSGPGAECGDVVCAPGEDCEQGRCVHYAGFGDDCTAENAYCIEGECVEGVCGVPMSMKPKVCTDSSDCEGRPCIDGQCRTTGILWHTVKPGGVCRFSRECEEGYVCVDGICTEYIEPECRADSDCGVDMWCSNGACEAKPGFGEPCDVFVGCAGNYTCLFDVCVDMMVETGGECDAEKRFCENGFCSDGVCHESAWLGEACDALHECALSDQRCIGGVCTQILGECESSLDCQGDSYCCVGDDCDVKNVCLAYEKGQIDSSCHYKTVPGLFEAAIQCEWKAPAQDDPYPYHDNVLMTPLVMKTPHDTGGAQSIIFTTYNNGDGGAPSGQGSDIRYYGVIRIINGENCELLESIFDDNNHIIGGSNLAMADVDHDGYVEIFAGRGQKQKAGTGGGIVSFHWNPAKNRYETWHSVSDGNLTTGWGGPSLHDLDGDGVPEVIGTSGHVFDSLSLTRLNPKQSISASVLPTVGDLDLDGKAEIVTTNGVYRWDAASKQWGIAYSRVSLSASHLGYADFGTENADGTFDFDHLDGRAEVFACGSSRVDLRTLNGQQLLNLTGLGGGGPCTVGDFDGDGLPEIATAFGDYYRVFDPRCKSAADGCAKPYVLWEKKSQDHSSSSTGSSLFDFDGDGSMEAVYADECYTRVYDGKTGDVLFSAYRSSATWHEYPVIADVDNDQSAEIIVGSNNRVGGPSPDPIHRGLRCSVDSDCKSNLCVRSHADDALGLCRCENNDQCNSRTDMEGSILDEYRCTDGLLPEDREGGKVCRAKGAGQRVTGVRVMRDRLDRWMSSRNLWNQHVYNITNINDDMTVPKLSEWIQNFALGVNLNNLRQNVQGTTGANAAPDITGHFVGDACQGGANVTLHAVICNRGTKMVAKLMPATFYKIDEATEARSKLCTSYTTANVPIGDCLPVSCEINDEVRGKIVIVVNDDGVGGKTTVECNENNNEAMIWVNDCPVN